MLIVLSDAMLDKVLEYADGFLAHAKNIAEIQKQLIEAIRKKPSRIFELLKQVKAVIIKILLCKTNSIPQPSNRINKNILKLTTYYKTISSRP